METHIVHKGDAEEELDLPPGFRFHPTDEELITHYLYPKVLESNFYAKAIAEVDLNKVEPWDLPWIAKMGEREFYFFCVRDRKYPTGSRTNRATAAGYWKATGKDKQIFRDGKILIGMKKTLVFYMGRAPKGEKTNWIMHEYRLESENDSPATTRNEWVISRIFQKSSDGKKIHISNMKRRVYQKNESSDTNLPELIDSSSYNQQTRRPMMDHVACFSNPKMENKIQAEMVDGSNDLFVFSKYTVPNPIVPNLFTPNLQNFQNPYYMGVSDIVNSNASATGFDLPSSGGHEAVQKSGGVNIPSGSINLDCLWNY